MERRYKSKSMVEASLMAALVLIMALISGITSMMFISTIVMPIPITILYVRHDKRIAIASSIVSMVLTSFLINPMIGLTVVLPTAITGVVFGYTTKNKLSGSKSILYVSIANLIGYLLVMIINIKLFAAVEPITAVLQEFVDMIHQMTKTMADSGLVNETNKQMVDQLNLIDVKMLTYIVPGSISIGIIITSILTIIIGNSVFKKLKYEVNPIPHFSMWHLDSTVGAVFIILSCITLFLNSKQIKFMDYIALTMIVLFIFVMVIQGLSLVVYFLKNKLRIGKGFLIFICVMLLFSNLLKYLIGLGILDLILDLREIDRNSLFTAIKKKLKFGT